MSLQNLQRKARRFEIVAHVKKKILEKAMQELAAAQHQRNKATSELENCKRAYFEGIMRLNEERISIKREKLEPLEQGVEFLKDKWMRAFQHLKDLEKKLEAHRHAVLSAQSDLESMQKIEGVVRKEVITLLDKIEQKNLDDIASQRHTRKMRNGGGL